MTSTKALLKGLTLRILPDRMLQIVKKVHYARVLEALSEDDEKDFRIVNHLVSPGDWVVDIGANIGVYTKYLSELVGAEGRVYSVEPVPLTLDILVSNVRKLGLKNVETINSAISDSDGIVTMEVPLYRSGGENFYEAKVVSKNADNSLRRIEVQSRTIDSLFSDLDHDISFIKCDAEGYELECVKGASGIIKNSKPTWLIEVSGDPDDPGSAAYETFRLLQESYEAFWFDGESLRKRNTGDRSVDYFFLSAKHLQALRERSFKARRVSIKD